MPNIKDALLKGHKAANGITYKVHIYGYNDLDHWMGKTEKSAPRFPVLRRD